jgi:hypothetical protein
MSPEIHKAPGRKPPLLLVQVSGAFPKKLATSGEFSSKHFNSEGSWSKKEFDMEI